MAPHHWTVRLHHRTGEIVDDSAVVRQAMIAVAAQIHGVVVEVNIGANDQTAEPIDGIQLAAAQRYRIQIRQAAAVAGKRAAQDNTGFIIGQAGPFGFPCRKREAMGCTGSVVRSVDRKILIRLDNGFVFWFWQVAQRTADATTTAHLTVRASGVRQSQKIISF